MVYRFPSQKKISPMRDADIDHEQLTAVGHTKQRALWIWDEQLASCKIIMEAASAAQIRPTEDLFLAPSPWCSVCDQVTLLRSRRLPGLHGTFSSHTCLKHSRAHWLC